MDNSYPKQKKDVPRTLSASAFDNSIILNSNIIRESLLNAKRSSTHEPSYLFTIITVNFNNCEGLKKTIGSVIKQTFTNFQYIVIDGASSDNSGSIISEYLSYIDIAIIEEDKGVYNAMNKGIDISLGKYILFLNSGDCFADEEVLSKVSDVIYLHNPKILYGNTRFQLNQKIWLANKNPLDIWKGMVCSHQSIFIDYELVSKYRFDENQKIVADWYMIMSCILDEKSCFHVLDYPISEIEPVGISSDFIARTLERWNLIRKKYYNDKQRLLDIDDYYLALINKDSTTPESKVDFKSLDVNKIDSRLVFLISMPRSGSTLLQRIIESSVEVGSCGESWVALPPIAATNTDISKSKYNIKLSNIAYDKASKEIRLDKNTLKRARYKYLQSIYSEILQKLNTSYFLDKTPRYVHIVQELYKIFPAAKFIVLTRHPSAVINSYASTWCKKDYKILSNDPFFEFDFTHGFSRLIKFVQKKHKNVFVVSYESLCLNPGATCSLLSKYLGFTVKPQINQSSNALNRSFGDPKQINSSKAISTLSLGSMGKQLDFKNLDYYEHVCSKIPKFVWKHFQASTLISDNKEKSVTSSNPEKIPSHSVVITCFNNQETIIPAIDSAINQIKKPDQIIIIDDYSTDNSVSVINDYIAMRDESIEIKLIQNTKNLGVSSSRHKAILSSTADFISTLDGDDTISPLKIDMEMKAIVKMGCEVAFSDIKVLTSTTTRILNTRGYHQKPVESILNNLLTRSVPVPRDLTFSRKIYDKAGGFDPSFNLYEDWMLKQRMAVLSGEKSWAHSGVIGTTYDRRNPGLSNKHAIQLCYAQLLVLVKNISYFKNFDIDYAAVMRTLFHRAPELEKIFTQPKIINLDKQSYNEYVFNRLFNMSRSLDDFPSYLSDPDVIVKEFSKI